MQSSSTFVNNSFLCFSKLIKYAIVIIEFEFARKRINDSNFESFVMFAIERRQRRRMQFFFFSRTSSNSIFVFSSRITKSSVFFRRFRSSYRSRCARRRESHDQFRTTATNENNICEIRQTF